jgi:hypothetical protein
MRTARQPTIRTWFVFVVLFAIPLALPNGHLANELGPNGDRSYSAIFAAGSSVPLISALFIGLCFRRSLWIALTCFILKSIWFVIVLRTVEYVGQNSWGMAFASTIWTDWWCIEILSKNGEWRDTPSYWLIVSAICSTIYALTAVLFAKTCRLRDRQTTCKTLEPNSQG